MSELSPSFTVEQLQEQIASLQQQLIEAQRASALGELVGTTTHEFNNILMTVMNYAKLGLRHQDQAARDRAFTKILQASERAAEITRSVLGMARNRKPNFEPTQLAELIREAMFLLEKEMQKYRIAVELEIHEVPKIPVIANQIQQVLLNLLINARQAMPNGGRLVVRLIQDTATQTVDLIVRDFGVGIPAESLKRIFDSYYTTKRGPDATGKGGTGLGLAACRNIVQVHQGKIRVESTVGKGTCFTIKLPMQRVETSETPIAVAVMDRQPPTSIPVENGF
ncbi:MAG: sensor histidine kinase [Pirellulaceae bacterium]|nr:sensor histidine kinase [Pirellulaceae bacterium]